MIRVLVVEDSPTIAELLVSMLESDPEIRVVGRATDGRQGVREARRLRPDLITMDVHMPELDGLAATKEIMTEIPTPIIIVSSAANESSVSLSLDAMQSGALMVLPTPESPLSESFEAQRDQLVDMTRAMSQVKVVRQWPARRPRVMTPVHASRSSQPPRRSTVVIGCSTGGPAALRFLLGALPADLHLSIVVVQHMAAGFVNGLASWLDGGSSLRVRVAEDHAVPLQGEVYLAPDDRHLGFSRDGRLKLSDAPPLDGFRPSISHLFSSAADVFGASAVGVLLTGMGNDGVTGLTMLKAAGAPIIVQDEESSVVFGMAQEAVRAGLPDAVLSLEAIAQRLVELAR